MRILILEDNPNDVQLIRYALRGLDYTSLLVATQAEFNVALDGTLDVILADCNFPQYNALQAPNEIKSRGLNLPLIVATGFLQEDAMNTLINLGAQSFIFKSDLAALSQMIQRVTDGH